MTAADSGSNGPDSSGPRSLGPDPLEREQESRDGGVEQDPRDIFISYSHVDKEWVDDYLVPRLEAAGLTIIEDDRDFNYGEKIEGSVRKNVRRCRHLLAIVSPAWNNSAWTQYESILAIARDPTGEIRGLIPVKIRPCSLPDHIKDRLAVDLTNIDNRDKELAKLFRQLGVREDVISLAQSALHPLIILYELMEEPGVQEEVSKFRQSFRAAQASIEGITNNKKLHDILQSAEQKVDDIAKPARRLAAGENVWLDVQKRVGLLRMDLETLLRRAAPNSPESLERAWVEVLRGSLDALWEAVGSKSATTFQFAFEEISSLVKTTLPAINDEIFREIKKMPLANLEGSLQSIDRRLGRFNFNDAALQLLDNFRQHIPRLAELIRKTEELAVNHNVLQMIDSILGLGGVDDNISVDKIHFRWRSLRPLIQKLRSDANGWKASCENLDQLLSNPPKIRDDGFEAQVQGLFQMFALEMKMQFNFLDVDLDARCRALRELGDELGLVISRMNRKWSQPTLTR